MQKTGFCCDQRANQQTVVFLCADEDVLDSCCFSGSFSFNAKSAAGINSNADSMPSANDNDIANSLQDSCSFAQAGVEDCAKKCAEEQARFYAITLHPPKLAPALSSIFH